MCRPPPRGTQPPERTLACKHAGPPRQPSCFVGRHPPLSHPRTGERWKAGRRAASATCRSPRLQGLLPLTVGTGRAAAALATPHAPSIRVRPSKCVGVLLVLRGMRGASDRVSVMWQMDGRRGRGLKSCVPQVRLCHKHVGGCAQSARGGGQALCGKHPAVRERVSVGAGEGERGACRYACVRGARG